MPDNTLPKPEQVLGGSKLPSPNQVLMPDGQANYEAALATEPDTNQFEQVLTNIPDINEAQKSNLRKLALNVKAGKATHEDLRDTILTYQNKNPKQDGSGQYYVTENMSAKPLASGERPPKGYDVANDYFGTQEEADKKGFLASAGSHLYNGVLKGVLGLESVVNLPYAMATGEDADWYKSAQNRVESSLMKTPSYETEQELFDAKDIKGIGDFFDSDRYNFTANTVQGAALSGLESITSFLVGTKGFGAAGTALSAAGKGSKILTVGSKTGAFLEGTTSAGVKAQALGGAYAITLPEVLQYVDDAGIKGTDKYRLAAAITVPMALTEMIGGTEALFAANAAAKKSKSAVIRGVVDAVKRNADGPLTKEFLTETFKATTKEAAQLNKSFMRELGENVVGEAATEGLQEFEKQGLAELYDHISKEDNFKNNPLSLEAFGEYYNAALQGGLGSIGAGAVGTLQKRSIDLHEKQSGNVFEVVKRGEEAVGALKENIAKSVQDGEITQDQAAELMFKVDAYDTYNKQTSGIGLEDADKKKVFELTFEKSNLDAQIPTEYEQKDLNGIEQAKIDAKKKQSKDIQNEINDIIQKAEVMNKTTTAAKKTVEDIDKKIESETEKPVEGKKPMSKTLQDLTNKYRGTEFETMEGVGKPKAEEKKVTKIDDRPYESIPSADWNVKVPSEKFTILKNKLESENETLSGNLYLKKEKGDTYDTVHINLPGKKFVATASSAKDLVTQLRGHFKTEFVEGDIDNLPVTVKPLQLTTGKTVLGVFNENNGRFIAYVREHKTGKSKYSEKEIEELQHMQAVSKLTKAELEYYKQKRNQPPTDEGEAGATEIVPTKPVTPTSPEGQTITNETTETGLVREPKQGAKEISKESEETTDKIEKEKHLIKSRLEKYNSLSNTEKKSENGVSLFRDIQDKVKNIGHNLSPTSKGKFILLNEKGKRVYKVPVKRSQDQIDESKREKEEKKRALNMEPQSLKHLVIMDVANGERFNMESLRQFGSNLEEIPALMKQEKGGIKFEFYKQRLAEMMGLTEGEDVLPGDPVEMAKEAADFASQYFISGGRGAAQQDAVEIYQRDINQGFTNEELKELQDANGLTDNEVTVIIDTVANATEKETDESLNTLKDEKNQNESTANEIVTNIAGEETTSNNPFDEIEREQEYNEDIISRDNLEGDAFQKPKELEYAEGQLAKAEKELKAAKSAFENKRKELGKEINADQEDLFGERQSTEGAGLFDERVDMSAYEGVIAPFKQRYDAAVKEYVKWQNKVKELEDKEDSQTSLFQKEQQKSDLKGNIDKVVETMKAAVPNVKIVYDENLTAAGKWSPSIKTITINPYYAGLDTPIHEVGHILIDAMDGMKNKVINNAINQLKDTDLWNQTKQRYPELNNEQLGYEVLAEAIGMEGAGIFDKQADKNVFMKYLEYIFDWLKRNLGLEKNIAKNLAKQIIAGIGTNVIVEGEDVLQKEKGKKKHVEYHAKSETQRAYERRLNKTQYRKQKFGAFPEDEVRDLNELNSIIEDENSDPNDVEIAAGLKAQLMRSIKRESDAYSQYLRDLKIADLYDKELSEGVSEKRLAEIINDLYTLQPEAAAEAQNRAKMMLAYGMFNKRKEELKKNEKFVEAVANKSDISAKDVLLKNLGHMTEAVPELQSFSKMFDKTHLDMAGERKKLKHTFETLGLAVIKEANKKLGIVGKAASVFSSDSAKYFEYLDDGKGNLLTEEQARTKGLSEAQIAFLKNYRDIIAERYLITEDLYNAELEVLKTDPTFAEAFKANGMVDAMSRFLGNSYNLNKTRIPFKNPNTGINEVADFQTIESELIKYGKKGTLEKAKAVGLLIHYNMKAKHQLRKGVNYDEESHPLELKDSGEYSVDYKGELVGKFGRPRDKNRGYSKDFYRAGIEFIDELTHTKHMSPLVPVINGIEFLNEKGFREHAKKPEVVKWIQDWRDMHLFKNTKQTIPELDVALKFLRFMTSATTMMFNVPASTMNLAMGIYNNWRAENSEKVAIGHSRLFGDIGKHKVNKEYGYGTINPYAVDILRKFDVVSIDYDSNPKQYIGRIFDNLGHGLTRYGEFQIQGSMFLGLLSKDEYNSFEYKKNKYGVDELVFKEGMTEEQIEKLKGKLISYKNRVSDIQGKYGDKDRRNIMNTELGKAVLQFRVYLPDAWKERFGKEYINNDGEMVRGSWRSFYGEGFKQLRESIRKDGIMQAFWNDKGAMSNLKGLLALTTLLVLKYQDDDDDDKRRTALSLDSAQSNLMLIFDPDQLKYMLKTPIAAAGTVEKFINLAEAMMDLDAEKTGEAALRLTPVYKAQKSVEEISRLAE